MMSQDLVQTLNSAVAELLIAAERTPRQADAIRGYAAQLQLIAEQMGPILEETDKADPRR